MIYANLTEQELLSVAKDFATSLAYPNVISFDGDLGAGKSTFSRKVIQTLLGDPDHIVPSPTFTLLQEYESSMGMIYHFDLYRLNDPQDLIELNFDECLQTGLCLIEWPQLAADFLPKNTIQIKLSKIDDLHRTIHIYYNK